SRTRSPGTAWQRPGPPRRGAWSTGRRACSVRETSSSEIPRRKPWGKNGAASTSFLHLQSRAASVHAMDAGQLHDEEPHDAGEAEQMAAADAARELALDGERVAALAETDGVGQHAPEGERHRRGDEHDSEQRAETGSTDQLPKGATDRDRHHG